jgi:hypothetical protein
MITFIKSYYQSILCPFVIIKNIIILGSAYILSYIVKPPIIFFAETRLEVFLFLAIFMDIFFRYVVRLIEIDENSKKGIITNQKISLLKILKVLFASNYGGLPLWLFCIAIVILKRSGLI